jgi:phosphoribosylformylglycinamidine cyclo-ligase
MGITYRDSGVDVEGGNRFVKRIAPIVKATFDRRVITDIGGFGALYSASFPKMRHPVLVSGADGVGTKLKIAQMMNKHDTVGIDAVAMCVNDILVSGAAPLFFLDYIACGRLDEDVMTDIVKGVAEGCRLAGCSLVGGETAEHPSLMGPGDYDIAGFAVGVVDRKKIIDGSRVRKGDSIIGLPSSGIHSNGYSLVRKLLLEVKGYSLGSGAGGLGMTLGEALLAPTRIYCQGVLSCLRRGVPVKGMVHITGGGFYENIPRILPAGVAARIDLSSITVPPVLSFIQREGAIDRREMYTTFNMGIGFMLVAGKGEADRALGVLRRSGEKPVVIGEIVARDGERVILK